MSVLFGVILPGGATAPEAVAADMGMRMARGRPVSPRTASATGVAMGVIPTARTPGAGITSSSGGLAVADARIDNRVELVAELGISAEEGSGLADVELLVRAFALWGDDSPDRVVGPFSLAIWDPEASELFLARDALGVRPLHYVAMPGGPVAFASEVKALLAVPGVAVEVDEAAVERWLEGDMVDREATLFQTIRRVPAAHSVRISARDGAAPPRRYWDLGSIPEIELDSDEAYSAAFMDRFTEAVRCRLPEEGAVGAALSGGLDSSSIACVAQGLLSAEGRECHAFSAIFPGLSAEGRAKADESEWIDLVTSSRAFVAHSVEADRIGPLTALDEVLAEQDEPWAGLTLFVSRALYSEVGRAGVGVYLEGVGGEWVVGSGSWVLRTLAEQGRWSSLGRELHQMEEGWGVPPSVALKRTARDLLHRMARRGRWIRLGRALRAIRTQTGIRRRHLFKWYVMAPFVPGWGAEPVEAPRQSANPFPPVLEHSLSVAARTAETHGIDLRYPFLDRRLLEFAVGIPDRLLLRDGWTRWLLRTSMKGTLPDAIRWRRDKQDLAPAALEGMLRHDRTRLEALRDAHGVPGRSDLAGPGLIEALTEVLAAPNPPAEAAFTVFHGACLHAWREGLRGDASPGPPFAVSGRSSTPPLAQNGSTPHYVRTVRGPAAVPQSGDAAPELTPINVDHN